MNASPSSAERDLSRLLAIAIVLVGSQTEAKPKLGVILKQRVRPRGTAALLVLWSTA